MTRDQIGPGYVSGDYVGETVYSFGFLIDPNTGRLMRRQGTSIFGSSTGLLETAVADATARALQIAPHFSPSLTDGYPSPLVLFSDEDKGFAWLYVRSATPDDYNLGLDFSTSWSYPITVGARQALSETTWKCFPVPYLANGVGLTRGAYEATRRYFGAGSRRFEQIGDQIILPSKTGTPIRWNGRFNDAAGAGTEPTRIAPLGGIPPIWTGRGVTTNLPTATTSTRAWKENDQFYVALVPVMEDGSWGPPCRPQPTNAAAPSGQFSNVYGLVTIPSTTANTDYYEYWILESIPKPPKGVRNWLYCRSPKVDSSIAGNAPNPFDLRVSAVLPITANSYRDYNGDDRALVADPRIRFDHKLPYPARSVFTMDGRLVSGYLEPPNPVCAFACGSGVSASLDQYAYDDESALGNNYFLLRVISGAVQLRYVGASPGAPATTSISTGASVSLRQLVDSINATVVGGSGKEWRAQLAPGADENATTDNLALTYLELTCTAGSGSATMTTSGSFTNVAVGMRVRHANVTAGTYVKSIESTTSLTLSAITIGAIAAATVGFNVDTGDDAIVNDSTYGNVRAFIPGLPAPLYWNRAYCEKYATLKQAVEFTGASPGEAPYAPDRFFVGNVRSVPARAGVFMGGGPLLNGAICWYSHGISRLANVRGGKTGADEDYRNEVWTWDDGAISPYSIIHGNGWTGALTRQGFVVTDGTRRANISLDIHNPTTGRGDLAYEIAACENAANTDGDDYGFFAHVESGRIWISFRRSGSGSTCDCVMCYDFSPSIDSVGVAQVLRPDGSPYGWSTHLEYNWREHTNAAIAGAIGSVRRSDGLYLLTADDSNDKTTCGLLSRFQNGTYIEGGLLILAQAYGYTDMCDTFDKKIVRRAYAKVRNPSATLEVILYADLARAVTILHKSASSVGSYPYGIMRARASSIGRSTCDQIEPVFACSGSSGEVEVELLEVELDTLPSRG